MPLILLTLSLITFTTVFSTTPPLLTDDFLQTLKQKATTWTPRQNFPIDTTIEQLQNLASLKGIHPNASFTFPVVNHKKSLAKVPTSFDSRSKWPKCSSMTTIRDQGQCGGCWAFAAAEVMSDRLCITTNGKQQFVFSPQDLISCCSDCGYGCEGGYLLSPYQYWISHGIPSGGDQGSGIGCKPFTARDTGVTPVCTRSCVNEQDYTKDLRYGVKAYQVVPNVEDIQQEISENGPVGTYFDVYLDFYYYGSGIYQHSYGSLVGGHAVKIIGWGEENGIPYWIVANSWGESWGENGFFKIRRGINNCQIETAIVAGKPNSTAGIYPENYSLLLMMSLIVIGVVFNKQ